MDALSDVLRVVRLTGGVFLDTHLTAPWSISGKVYPGEVRGFAERPRQIIGFHYVVSGRLLASVIGGEPVELGAGEVVLLPRNDMHILASSPDLTPVPAARVVLSGAGIGRMVYGGGGEETHIVCGYLGSDEESNPVVAALPPLITLDVSATRGGAWIAQSFAFAAQTLGDGAAGGAAMISKLSELMFVEAVRSYIEGLAPGETGWLAGLRDPVVSKALALMHTEPQRNWSTVSLAAEVNLSRSAFADRFTTLMGQPPITYLTGWRLQVAARKLRDSSEPVSRIAYDVGYESEAAFTRAFRRKMGAPPASWRKQAALPD